MNSAKIIKLQKNMDELGRFVYRPEYAQHMPIFKHFTDGFISVTEEEFVAITSEIIKMHGYTWTVVNKFNP